MSIDLKSLRYFVAVAEAGSITKAAGNMHIAQPALSLHMKKMEEELNVTLFERGSKGIAMTAAGLRFLEHSRDILSRFHIACEEARDASSEPSGTISIGMPQSTGMALTVRLVQETLLRWPKLKLQIVESSTGHIPTHLAARNIDVGIVFLQEKNSGLRYQKIIDEELVLIGPAGAFPAVNQETDMRRMPVLEFSELGALPLFLPSPRHGLRKLIDQSAHESHTSLNVLADVDAILQLISLTAQGHGHTILSFSAVRSDLLSGRLSAARLVNPTIGRDVFLCRLEDTPVSTAVLAMESLIVSTIEKLVTEKKWICTPWS